MVKKKVKKVETIETETVGDTVPLIVPILENKVIHPLSIDFTSEQLNDMARKINEIIIHINN